MKSRFFVALAAIAVIAGCAKDVNYEAENPAIPGKRLVTINAGIVQTKTTVSDDGMYSWQNTEQIGVVETDGSTVIPFNVKNATAGTFTGELTEGKEPVFAVSPASAVSDVAEAGGLVEYTITFDNISNYVPGTTNALMIGTKPTPGSENSYSFEFRHAAALVKVPVVNVPVGTAKVKLTMDKPITGIWEDLDSTSPVIGPSVAGDPYLTLTLKDAITEPNTSADFYFPVPVNTYTSFQFELLDADGTRIKGVKKSGLNITLAIADLFITPTITLEGVKKGASNTLNISSEAKFPNSGSLTENGITWTPSITAGIGSPTPGSIDQNNIRGQQFGAANTNTTKSIQFTGTGYEAWSASATSDANAIGITNINVTVGAKNGNTVTIDEVSVGGIKLVAVSGNTYTAADGQPATIAFSSESVLTGDIVIKATLTTAGAFYLKRIEVNPTPSLPAPVITATSNVSTVTISWDAVNNAKSYDVEIVNQDDATISFSATGLTELTKSFENVPDGTYDVTVTAKAEGFNDGIGVTTVVVKAAGPDKYGLIEENGAFEDGGKYVFVLPDGETPTTYYVLHTHRTLEASGLTITNGIITEPADKYIWVAEAGSESGTFALMNLETGEYLPNASGTTTGASSSSVNISLEYLSNSGAYCINLGSRYVGYADNTEAKFYANSNFYDQIEAGTSLSQFAGAFKVYKLNYSPKEAFTTPTGLSVSDMVLSWNAVSGAASYNVTIGETVVNGVNTNSYTFTGEAGYYNVSVVAVPSDTDAYKNSAAATLTDACFGTPTIATPILESGGVTIDSVTATWTADANASNGYHCEIYNGENKIAEKDVTVGTVTFDGLTEGVTYTVKVNGKAVTGDKPYAVSAVATIDLTPDGIHIEDVNSAKNYSLEGLTVMAVYLRNIIVADATGTMLIYGADNHGFVVGDVVNVQGSTQIYQGVWQFNGPTITKTGTTTVAYPTPVVYDETKITAYATASVTEYGTAVGVADATGRTITVADGKILNVYGSLESVDGETVTIKGYAFGYSSSKVKFMMVGDPVLDPNAPTLSVNPETTAASPASWAADNDDAKEFTVTATNGTWSFNADDVSSWANVSRSGDILTVTPKEKQASEAHSGSIVITLTPTNSGYENKTATIYLSQAKYGAGGTPKTSTLTFTAKCNGSGTADDNVSWTVTSDGSESNFDETKGIHYGTNSAQVTYIKLSTSDITGTITQVVVNASTASGVSATASVTVGGNAFGGNAQSLSTTASDYTFTGSAQGEIVVTVTKPSKATKAIYVKSVIVTYNN